MTDSSKLKDIEIMADTIEDRIGRMLREDALPKMNRIAHEISINPSKCQDMAKLFEAEQAILILEKSILDVSKTMTHITKKD